MGPRVSHIKYRNLYAGSAKCDAGGKQYIIIGERERPSRTTGNEFSIVIIYTLFTRILAAATINFSRARVRLLIEGGSY